VREDYSDIFFKLIPLKNVYFFSKFSIQFTKYTVICSSIQKEEINTECLDLLVVIRSVMNNATE
jgi:hypothetical protein